MGSGDGDFPMIKKLSGCGTLFWIIDMVTCLHLGASIERWLRIHIVCGAICALMIMIPLCIPNSSLKEHIRKKGMGQARCFGICGYAIWVLKEKGSLKKNLNSYNFFFCFSL